MQFIKGLLVFDGGGAEDALVVQVVQVSCLDAPATTPAV